MTPSAILSRAADLIRDTAAAATEGPWESDRQFSHANVVYAKRDLIDSVGVAGRRLDLPPVFTGQIASRARSQFEADARWIALMSPAVAPAIEGWLRHAAEMWDYPDQPGNDEWALDFARAVLGEKEDTDG